jgi:hypothetical protein
MVWIFHVHSAAVFDEQPYAFASPHGILFYTPGFQVRFPYILILSRASPANTRVYAVWYDHRTRVALEFSTPPARVIPLLIMERFIEFCIQRPLNHSSRVRVDWDSMSATTRVPGEPLEMYAIESGSPISNRVESLVWCWKWTRLYKSRITDGKYVVMPTMAAMASVDNPMIQWWRWYVTRHRKYEASENWNEREESRSKS